MVLAVVIAGCAGGPSPVPSEPASAPPARALPSGVGQNVLLLLVDDIGPMSLASYGPQPEQPPTPTMDRLAAEGVRFDNVWAFPLCTPARAALLTGRWPSRMGLNTYLDWPDPWSLPLREVTLPELLRRSPHGYRSALVGKWHLTSYFYASPAFAALDHGFDTWTGSFENLTGAIAPDGEVPGFEHWEKVTNGVVSREERYATTVTVDDALRTAGKLREPWFLEVAFNAAHYPPHEAPEELSDLAADVHLSCGLAKAQCWRTEVEAFDRELGRLLDGLGPDLLARTTVVLTADNGPDGNNIPPPFDRRRCKGTLYDGGLRVPLVVTGPLVDEPGATSHALVSLADLYPTVAAWAGVDPGALPDIDGVDFGASVRDPGGPSAREFLFASVADQNGPPPWTGVEYAVRDAGWKLVRGVDGVERVYAYRPGQLDEGEPLPEDAPGVGTAHARLRAELDRQVARAAFEGP